MALGPPRIEQTIGGKLLRYRNVAPRWFKNTKMRGFKMRDQFYSVRHMERVQQMENKGQALNTLFMVAVFALLYSLVGVAGSLDYQSTRLVSKTSQNALESSTLTEPTDIQPAYGINALQQTANMWTIQGNMEKIK